MGRNRKRNLLVTLLAASFAALFIASAAYARAGFIIHKVDDKKDPVEGAVFDVYGKPEVSWEKDDTTPTPCRHDPPVEKTVTATGDEPATPATFSFTMKATNSSYPMVPGSTNG
ncbi:MAG: hypothetical protein J5935_00190, partial [Lachnospiraceae bacterium]|nr:hypothetical protein [Lachnospiraceae bacterium]